MLQLHNIADSDPKALGAFYTDGQVAEFLVWWSVRSSTDRVIDPSFGGGVFLRSACDRLIHLGADPAQQVYGVEIEPKIHNKIALELQTDFGLPKEQLILDDFFAIAGDAAPRVDVVVGNPPFIRYQRFTGEIRKRALTRALEQGLKLSKLSSSWLPFLAHSVSLLQPGGRLAMVIPVEITHAAYARPVLEYLANHFAEITFLTFQKKLFPQLCEDTLLLLAEGKGASAAGRLLWRDLPHAGALKEMRMGDERLFHAQHLDADITSGMHRLIEYFISPKARALYRELKQRAATNPLGNLADVGIGYVTGANDFFHLNAEQVATLRIPDDFLRRAVRRGRSLSGVVFTKEDWRHGLKSKETAFLLHIPPKQALPGTLRRYIESGEQQGIAQAYKCRTRSPWFSVPHVYQPDAFLSYMSGTIPRLVANTAGAVAPNSLHIVRVHKGAPINANGLAALWQTSLSNLSAEIEGHAMGGGMLKLEPTEAENVLLPNPNFSETALDALAHELDSLARQSGAVEEYANREVLQRGLGLTKQECRLIAEAAVTLRHRRLTRSTHDEKNVEQTAISVPQQGTFGWVRTLSPKSASG